MLPDGRILEYFTYGATRSPDAEILIQVSGTFGTGKIFTEGDIPKKLEELNVKGISITVPGHAYSTVNVGRRIVDFVADVQAVLDAEKVTADDCLYIEGTSYGTSHAMALAWFFGKTSPERVLGLHLHVPYISNDLAEEVIPFGARAKAFPGGSTVASLQRCFPGCCHFCCLSCVCCCFRCCMKSTYKDPDCPLSGEIQARDVKRSVVHSVYGPFFNNIEEHCLQNWGFDPREIPLRGKARVLVSYAEDDDDSPPDHGRWLGEFFQAEVNLGKGKKHDTFMARFFKGELVEQLIKLEDAAK